MIAFQMKIPYTWARVSKVEKIFMTPNQKGVCIHFFFLFSIKHIYVWNILLSGFSVCGFQFATFFCFNYLDNKLIDLMYSLLERVIFFFHLVSNSNFHRPFTTFRKKKKKIAHSRHVRTFFVLFVFILKCYYLNSFSAYFLCIILFLLFVVCLVHLAGFML